MEKGILKLLLPTQIWVASSATVGGQLMLKVCTGGD